MTRKRTDYTEARNYYIKGERNEYPTLQDIATEFNYSLSTLRKQAANEGWLSKRKERINLKEIIKMRKDFMGKAIKLSRLSSNSISAADFLILKIKEELSDIKKGIKPYNIHIASKQIWTLNQALKLAKLSQNILDEIENGYMSPLDDDNYL